MGKKVSDARTGAVRRRSHARRALAASGYGCADRRTPADEKRLRRARDVARRSVADASERHRQALDLAFRQAIGAAVRLVSPFLVSLLRDDLAELDRLARTIAPSNRWLDALCETGNSMVGFADATDVIRRLHGSASIDSTNIETGPGTVVWDGSATKIVVVGHSLEVEVRVGTMRFETRLGMLHIEMERSLPETLATACVGRPVESIVDHASLRGRGWTIVAVEPEVRLLQDQTLIVATGSSRYRLPWAR